ncbi:MAG TPA: magnesium chelatase [candidate division Zixibacteria bacterium]|nr:magnesium chelatase [candidate division Zixibacteria bacterium]
MKKHLAHTLGELKQSGYTPRTVKQELRENLLVALQNGDNPFPGVVGYEKTVLPQIYNAILARHNFILLGLRGQAKTRMIRQLYHLLDEFIPCIPGSPLNESPFDPITPKSQALVNQRGDDLELHWLHRSERYHEKLATPDVSIADLIGDIDPIKAAREKLDISDAEVINWGIIPRTNRGIFAINEAPDLQPRIQVGLLNILEENDIQVRGFPIRVPLDLALVFTANPEDYTNRGNLITPLKDRIDSQIITHYPKSLAHAREITQQEAWSQRGTSVCMPELMKDIIEEIAYEARHSEYVDQTSGVSARVSIAAYESLISSVERRAALNGENDTYPRISDLYATLPALTGKLELVYEGEMEGPSLVATTLIGKAIKKFFLKHFPEPKKSRTRVSASPDGDTFESDSGPYEAVTDFFTSGMRLELSDDSTLEAYRAALDSIPGLKGIVKSHFQPADEGETYLRMELVLEGLHQNNVLAKEIREANFRYSDMLSNMLRDSADDDDLD